MRDKDTLTNTQRLNVTLESEKGLLYEITVRYPALHITQHESKDQGIAALIYLNSNIFFVLIILKETEELEQSFY